MKTCAPPTTSGFSVGAKLRALRIKEKLSQEQLATRSGVTSAYIGQIERGEKNPTVMTVEKLCSSVGVTLAEFFDNSKQSDSRENAIYADIQKKLKGFNANQLELIDNVLTNMMKLTDIKS